MSLLEKYRNSTKENALKILDQSLSKLEGMETVYSEMFPYASLSAASSDFAASDFAKNEKVAKAVSSTLDAIASVDRDIRTLETFLRLHIPKMEDGNNFGVTVQLALLKEISDLQGVVASKIDDLSGYAAARADALDKLKLPSTGVSVTKSTSVTTTDGKKEEKTSESTEEKKSTSDETGPTVDSRKAALVAVDTQYYSRAQRAFEAVMTAFMASLDFLDKNKEKLEKPKGSGGSHSGYSSMY